MTVGSGMKVKAGGNEASSYAALLATQNAAVMCKERDMMTFAHQSWNTRFLA